MSSDSESYGEEWYNPNIDLCLGDGDHLALTIDTLTGEPLQILASTTDTVLVLKHRITLQCGIPPQEQHLLHDNNELDDSMKLSKLTGRPQLTLVLTMKGGPLGNRVKDAPMRVLHIPSRSSSNSSSSGGSVFLVQEEKKIYLIKMKSKKKLKTVKSSKSIGIGTSSAELTADRIQDNMKTKKKMQALRKALRTKKLCKESVQTCCEWKQPQEMTQLEKSVSTTALSPKYSPRLERRKKLIDQKLQRLRAELLVQSRRFDGSNGEVPYTNAQLLQYVRLKISELVFPNQIFDKHVVNGSGFESSITPTVVLNRTTNDEFCYTDSSSNNDTPMTRKGKAMKAKISWNMKSRPMTGGRKEVIRCGECHKRLSAACRYKCHCGIIFCASHRYAEAHHCSYDYKSHGRKVILENNPPILPHKLPQI